jgi:hypothetical protein
MFGTCAVLRLIGLERQSQVRGGKTVKYDAAVNGRGQLVMAAIAVLSTPACASAEPPQWVEDLWQKTFDKPAIDKLVLAAALLVAEIERLNYAEATPPWTRRQTAGRCSTGVSCPARHCVPPQTGFTEARAIKLTIYVRRSVAL